MLRIFSRHCGLAIAAVLIVLQAQAAIAAGQDHSLRFDIPAQELAQALLSFSQQSGIVVVAPSELVKGKQAPAVSGELLPAAAVQRLLEGSDLAYTLGKEGQFIITRKGSTASGRETSSVTSPEPPGGLQEIVVTATRRSEELGKVPMSIAAFTQEQLDLQGAHTFADVARLTPGVTFTPGTRGNTAANSLSIRGIYSGTGAATVGVYIDETPVQVRPQSISSSNPYPRVFDLNRIEILRGPQGTLFGAGSEGGTIRFITPEPSLTQYNTQVRSELSTIQHGDRQYELGGAIGGPIVADTLGFRVSAWYRKDGGYVDRIDWNTGRVLDSNANSQDAAVIRGALKWKPTEYLTVTPSVFFQSSTINDSSIYWESLSDPGQGRFINGNPVRTPTRDRFTLPALKIQLDLGQVSLFSNTSYFTRTNRNTYDQTTIGLANLVGWPNVLPPPALAADYAFGNLADKQDVMTQELRLQNSNSGGRLDWVVGVFFQRAKQNSYYSAQRPFLNQEILFRTGQPLTVTQFFGVPLYQGIYQLYAISDTVDRDLSGYGNIDFKLTERLKLIAGVRVSSIKYTNQSFTAGPTGSSSPTGVASATEQSNTPVSPKYGLTYQASPQTLLYATAAKGFRPGSTTDQITNRCAADLAALGLTAEPRAIAPDTVWSYEIGSKNRFLDGRLQLDASLYRIDWKNIQSSLILPNCNIPTQANMGNARSQGFDLLASANLGHGLSAGGSLGYDNAKYITSTLGAGGRVIRSSGEPLPVPPWTLALWNQYDTQILGRASYFRADYQYASHNNTPLDLASAATDPTLRRPPSSSKLDLRAGMKFGGLDLSLFVANAFDQDPEYGRYRDTLKSFNYRGVTVTPRTIGVTGVYRY